MNSLCDHRDKGDGVLKKILLGIAVIAVGLGFFWKIKIAPNIADPRMLLQAAIGSGIDAPDASRVPQLFELPDGLGIQLFYSGLPNVRDLLVLPSGGLLATTPRSGTVHFLEPDQNGDGKADARQELLTGLNKPHGLLLFKKWLYVAETDAVKRFAFDSGTGKVVGGAETIVSGLPGNGNHWARNLMAGADGWIYINIGSSCNVCIEQDSRRGSIMRFRPDGSDLQVYASGLRNSMAMAVAPWSREFYALDIARDLLGDDFPADEMNRVVQGGFYGWPYANDDAVIDPSLGEKDPARAAESLKPVFKFPAHTTPLDLHFIVDARLGGAAKRSALVTLHGSWNRSELDGYRVEQLIWHDSGEVSRRVFLSGFLGDSGVRGRPVDIEEHEGVLYLSDDYAGAIYAIGIGLTDRVAMPSSTVASAEFDTAEVAAGASLFERYGCGGCHVADQHNPDPNLIDLSTVALRYDAKRLADFFLAPNPPMPVFPLSDSERSALAAYLLDSYQQAR